MQTQPRWPLGSRPLLPRNERGIVLVVGLMILAALTMLGATAAVTTMADMKVGANYRRSTEAFYLAEAGAEHGRAQLRMLNAASATTNSFTDELATVRGPNTVLNGYVTGTDDVPLIAKTTLGNGSYRVYLTNDAGDGALTATDTNRRATLISVATVGTTDASLAIIETTVAIFQLFPLPAAITLLGQGAQFLGNDSNAKELHGEDQCGTEPPKPVVAVSAATDVGSCAGGGLQGAICGSKPETYWTKNPLTGVLENGSTPGAMNDIANSIPTSQLSNIQNNYGINLLDPVALTGLVTSLQAQADTVCSGGCSGVDIGTPAAPRVVVVQGDFTLSSSGGAGILVVTGTLTFKGNVDYTGMIMVIGDGVMQRDGGGNGAILGGIVVANTRGPDSIRGTADDNIALGPPTIDTRGGGNSTLSYCSSALNNAYKTRPLTVVSWRPRYK